MTSRRAAHETARLRLARYRVEHEEGRLRAAMHATQVSAGAVSADRVGVWLFDETRGLLRCVTEYHAAKREHQRAPDFDSRTCPAYTAAIDERRVLAIEDLRTHQKLGELAESFADRALLHAPIIRNARVIGVVRYDALEPRSWSQADVDFASSVADIMALFLEQAERLELEAALSDQAEQRQESQKMEALGRMASAISHDFNNILNTISMTLASAVLSGASVASVAQQVRQVLESGQGLTQKLVTFAKERADSTPVSCDLGKAVEGMLSLLRTAAGPRAVLSFEALPTPLGVALDRSQAEQILLNLVLNARDASASEVRIVLREATLADEVPPGFVALAVIDNGTGMAEATRSRVFEPFFTTKEHGSGLGLSTVLGLVRGAGGQARVESEPGAGTTLLLFLPRRDPG